MDIRQHLPDRYRRTAVPTARTGSIAVSPGQAIDPREAVCPWHLMEYSDVSSASNLQRRRDTAYDVYIDGKCSRHFGQCRYRWKMFTALWTVPISMATTSRGASFEIEVKRRAWKKRFHSLSTRGCVHLLQFCRQIQMNLRMASCGNVPESAKIPQICLKKFMHTTFDTVSRRPIPWCQFVNTFDPHRELNWNVGHIHKVDSGNAAAVSTAAGIVITCVLARDLPHVMQIS